MLVTFSKAANVTFSEYLQEWFPVAHWNLDFPNFGEISHQEILYTVARPPGDGRIFLVSWEKVQVSVFIFIN